ncbi:MAG: ABC transporter substrate-binding protein [Victivallaceae bacterium]|nr:ABC transporter substrate-binding protein [Victivallaceae bacterium]
MFAVCRLFGCEVKRAMRFFPVEVVGLKKTYLCWSGVIGLLFCICFLSGCLLPQEDANAPFLVAAVLPTSGEDRQTAKLFRAGIEAAVSEYQGEVAVKVLFFDSGDGGRNAFKVTSDAVNQFNIGAVFCGYHSSEAMAAKAALAGRNIPLVIPLATNDRIGQGLGNDIFMMSFSDSIQARAIAYYLRCERRFTQIAVMSNLDENSIYGRDLAQSIGEHFFRFNGAVVKKVGFHESDKDFTLPIREMLMSSPQAVVVPAFPPAAGRILRQLRQMGFHGLIVGTDSWRGAEYFQEEKEFLGDNLFTTGYDRNAETPENQRFKRLAERRKFEVADASAMAYDAMTLLGYAIARDRYNVAGNLAGITHYQGVSGRRLRDSAGRSAKSVYFKQLRRAPDGKSVIERTIRSVEPQVILAGLSLQNE